jgi:general secretion pathway protein B
VSLILDALRKADSERERGEVPGLRAQPLTPPSLAPRRRAVPLIVWIVAGLALATLITLFAYRASRPVAAPMPVAQPGQPVAPTVSPQSGAPVGPTSAPPVAVVVPPPIVEEVQAAKPAPWSPPDGKEVVKSEDPGARSPPKEVAMLPETKAPPRPAANVEAPIMTRAQLPDSLRAQLPPLVIGGSIYSSNAANRSVIINGQVWRENDTVAPDLVLEQIKPKGAVFRFKGTRFEQPL